MGEGITVYRTPRKSMPPKQITKRAKLKWEKHRIEKGKDPKLPELKK